MSDQAHDHDLIRKTSVKTGPDAAPDPTPDVNPLTRLQRMIGNRAVQRLMTPSGQPIMTKMNVTSADDATEAEADAVAEQVVRKVQREEAPSVQREAEEDELQMKRIQREADGEEEIQEMRISRAIQREADGEEEIQEKRISRAATDMMGAFSVGEDFESQLNSARGGGKSLDESTASKMGSAMGADFSNVRIHEGPQADSLSNSIQAKAFTTGSDIFFKSGTYNPGSTDGQKLLAHELTHTIQQGAVNTKREEK